MSGAPTLLAGTDAELRSAGRRAGHPRHDRSHANDLWIAAPAVHISARARPATAPQRRERALRRLGSGWA
jgi:hypothetical protein